jgi:hypothetical protein
VTAPGGGSAAPVFAQETPTSASPLPRIVTTVPALPNPGETEETPMVPPADCATALVEHSSTNSANNDNLGIDLHPRAEYSPGPVGSRNPDIILRDDLPGQLSNSRRGTHGLKLR